MTYEDGSTYEGLWELDLRHGQGTLTMKDDVIYSGQWELDQTSGKGDLNIPAAQYKYSGVFCYGY